MKRKDVVKKCKSFKPGDLVTIIEHGREEDGKARCLIKTKGKILEKYPNFILIGRGRGYAIRECFTYTDIALFACIEKSRRVA